jgi:c-di-GMP-binding flagellar brake protein YcgR
MAQASETRLSIGQRVEIGFPRKLVMSRAEMAQGVDRDALDWVSSRIEDIGEVASTFTVAWPTDTARKLVPFQSGDELTVASCSRDDATYSATASVVSMTTEPIPLLTLSVAGTWQRSQRRSAFRMSVAIRPRVATKLYGEAYRPIRLGITNLSATGMQVRSQDELRPGDLLDIAFELMGVEGEIEVQARVRRVHRLERVWDAGCELEAVPDRLARRIVQFVFAQQRAVARKRG